jgi:hypothetical protein
VRDVAEVISKMLAEGVAMGTEREMAIFQRVFEKVAG